MLILKKIMTTTPQSVKPFQVLSYDPPPLIHIYIPKSIYTYSHPLLVLPILAVVAEINSQIRSYHIRYL